MKTIERCQWRRSSVLIVNCEHTSNFVLIVDFEQTNVCCDNIEKINTFEEDQVYHALCCVILSVNNLLIY